MVLFHLSGFDCKSMSRVIKTLAMSASLSDLLWLLFLCFWSFALMLLLYKEANLAKPL